MLAGGENSALPELEEADSPLASPSDFSGCAYDLMGSGNRVSLGLPLLLGEVL